jgi:hypothetical protein
MASGGWLLQLDMKELYSRHPSAPPAVPAISLTASEFQRRN